MWNRRAFLRTFSAFAATRLAASSADSPMVAITMDDFGWEDIPEPWRARASDTLLSVLQEYHLHAAAFIAGNRVDSPEGLAIVRHWRDAGHLIGNHTYSHRHIDSLGLAAFEADALKNQHLLSDLLTTPKYFRFPMLKEGGTIEVRDGMRAFLKQQGYRNGAVTIDASDWYYSSRLTNSLKAEPGFDVSRYREPYLRHIADRATYYDGLATALLHRQVRHTLLIHFNLINVLFLSDLLKQFVTMGWRLVDASEAFHDSVFDRAPQTIPAGESLIWALAKESGQFEKTLRYPGEDDVYEKPLLDNLKL